MVIGLVREICACGSDKRYGSDAGFIWTLRTRGWR